MDLLKKDEKKNQVDEVLRTLSSNIEVINQKLAMTPGYGMEEYHAIVEKGLDAIQEELGKLGKMLKLTESDIKHATTEDKKIISNYLNFIYTHMSEIARSNNASTHELKEAGKEISTLKQSLDPRMNYTVKMLQAVSTAVNDMRIEMTDVRKQMNDLRSRGRDTRQDHDTNQVLTQLMLWKKESTSELSKISSRLEHLEYTSHGKDQSDSITRVREDLKKLEDEFSKQIWTLSDNIERSNRLLGDIVNILISDHKKHTYHPHRTSHRK